MIAPASELRLLAGRFETVVLGAKWSAWRNAEGQDLLTAALASSAKKVPSRCAISSVACEEYPRLRDAVAFNC